MMELYIRLVDDLLVPLLRRLPVGFGVRCKLLHGVLLEALPRAAFKFLVVVVVVPCIAFGVKQLFLFVLQDVLIQGRNMHPTSIKGNKVARHRRKLFLLLNLRSDPVATFP